ncbi:hypothetical protein FBU30_009850 [Linnemannia zychae]|nr:hypothetical protein FBU30_009850 [Linnemannia zychae]
MADYVVDISDGSPPKIPESQIPSPSIEALAISPFSQSSAEMPVINQPNMSSESTPLNVHRWYFKEKEESSSTDLDLILSEEHQSPVKVDVSRKLTKWTVPMPSDYKEGTLYDIVIGVSAQDLTVDSVQSILLQFDQLSSTGGGIESEVIRASELERMTSVDEPETVENSETQNENSDEDTHAETNKNDDQKKEDQDTADKPDEKKIEVFRWMLHTPSYGSEDGITITMDICTWVEVPLDYGSLDLHFVELCSDAATTYKADPLFKEHIPYCSWVIDVNRSGCPEYDARTTKQKIIENYSVSGDERFAAIKVSVGDEEYLEVWNLEDQDIIANKPKKAKEGKDTNILKNNEVKTCDEGTTLKNDENISSEESDEKVPEKPHRATPIAWMLLPTGDFDVSISWDGSQVALLDRTKPKEDADQTEESTVVRKSKFAIFRCGQNGYAASEKTPSKRSLVRYDVQQTCPLLKNYLGDGIFHMVDWFNPDLKDELFVTCNGITIEVYSAVGDWSHIRSIALDSSIIESNQTFDIGGALFNQLRDRYFIVGNEESTAFTFDIVSGNQVSFTSAVLPDELRLMNYLSCVSEDGTWIAIADFRHVSIYRTETWTLHRRYTFHELASDERVANLASLYNGSYLCVMIGSAENITRQTRPGYVIDVTTLVVINRLAPDGRAALMTIPYSGDEQYAVYTGRSKFSCLRVEDRNHRSPPKYPIRCDDDCLSADFNLTGVEEGTSRMGLYFKIQKTKASTGSHHKREKRTTLTVTMSDPTKSQTKRMVVPLPDGVSVQSSAFLGDFRYLILVTTDAHMIWTVPTTFDGEFRLQKAFLSYFVSELSVCPHGSLFVRQSEEGEMEYVGGVAHSMSLELSKPFLSGLAALIRIYELADPVLKQEIVRYYGRHINTYFINDEYVANVMFYLSYLWDVKTHHYLCDFLKDLLNYSGYRWVPLPSMSIDYNPLNMFIELADIQPLAIKMVEIIIDYCVDRAKAENDPVFLGPIRQCLPILLDPKKSYSDFALKVYREIAFFPAQGQEFISRHHALANPLTFRWAFWKQYPWGLHQHKDQVMQLELKKVPNPPKGTFTREIYQASFDFLWRKTSEQESTEESQKTSTVEMIFSWPLAIWTMILRKCRLRYTSTIECHPFELDALDNPALMALVEYKWNTIGFNYWLVRFLGQIVYYILVLVAVFIQIYGDTHVVTVGESPEKVSNDLVIDLGPEGLFIAIIPVAFLFLWLEFNQLLKDPKGYIRSIYNMVDLLVFCLPLAGAIDQILAIHGMNSPGGNPGLLSFSVLIIFLHFLFELRVFQVVCHFVSIIIRAIYSIRVFFFVFGAGLLAFSIAILHLFYVCRDADSCSYYTEDFDHNLWRSLSMTYFMLGGSYDQVQGGFTSDSFAFHFMMVLFFFFSVILMLNVLIALINNAIDDGDNTWRLDWMEYRMRYVESAENMTYDIPGFRDNHNYFPDIIYYTGTALQVREYVKETQRRYGELGQVDTPTALSAALAPGVELSFAVDVPVGEEKELTSTDAAATTAAATTAAATTAAATTAAATTAAAISEATSVTAHAGAQDDPVMAMLKKQYEDHIRREEEQRKRYEEQMKLLAEQSRRLEEQHKAMIEMQSELRLLKERS